MRRYRATKIVATLGPVSSNASTIESLFLAGVDVFRLNFSHGRHEDHLKNIHLLRELETKYRRPIGIMQDLQGPKIRVGLVEDGVVLQKGQIFNFDLRNAPGTSDRVQLPHPELFEAIRAGTIMLINDGAIRVHAVDVKSEKIVCEVLVGGPLKSNKGVNIPGIMLPVSSLTEKDRIDLEVGLSSGVDWIAQSFVQTPQDVKELRDLVGDQAGIIAKIEKPLAVQHIKEIITLSDAIMIARGDLGVEMQPEEVPSIQKQIVRDCRAIGRPVIVATQMLESMIHSPVPTRAEASDVACAVYEGVDAVMLSAETASGENPVQSVNMMNRIIERIEADPFYRKALDTAYPIPTPSISDAITSAARRIADTLDLKAIVTLTSSGTTTLRAARERPNAPIVGLTPDRLTAHILTLTWGTHPIFLPSSLTDKGLPELMQMISKAVLTEEFADPGHQVLVTVGAQIQHQEHAPIFTPGSTKGLFILTVKNSDDDA